jgi:hypothetical protein
MNISWSVRPHHAQRASLLRTTTLFRVRIVRGDGLLCFDVDTAAALSLPAAKGRVLVALRFERLDLNTWSYLVDAVCYARDRVRTFDYRLSACFFVVLGSGDKEAMLNTPYSWAASAVAATPTLAEAGGQPA